jgi:formamidopyrimidine-DNA glycosylase
LEEATVLQEKLQSILSTAVTCLENREEYPEDWLFRSRWAKRSANNGNKVTDSKGRNVVYLKAGGRTSAIVPSIQVKRSQKAKGKTKKKRKNYASQQKDVEENEQDAEKLIHKKRKRSDSKTVKREENVQDAEEKPKKRKRPDSKRAKREAKKSSMRATEKAPRRSARLSSS